MQTINEKPKICTKEWFAVELRKSNRELKQLRKQVADEERKSSQVELFKLRSRNLHLKNQNESLKKQIKDLSKLPDQLQEVIFENKKLAKELNRRKGTENPYGLSTPSSKQVNKKNSTKENQKKRGGGKKGHKGYGKKDFTEEEADRSFILKGEKPNCDCNGDIKILMEKPYCVYRYIPAKMEKVLYTKEIYQCSVCGCSEQIKIPGILPNYTYSNSTIANMLTEHYYYGSTAGSLINRWNINRGTFFNFAHNTSNKLLSVFDQIVLDLRSCFIIHADETPWKKDGAGGYAWFFGNDKIKVFIFRHTRSSAVPISILGTEKLKGVLITDRYSGYVRILKIARQYCLVHIIRDVKKEEDSFPDSKEVQAFTADLKALLKKIFSLRNDKKNLEEYLKIAENLQTKIMNICNVEAKHPAVQHLQNIFREHQNKLFQWTKSPEIPADNNYAERALRPTVISRKISFGSHSEQGLKTREIMMTILHTAKCYGWENPAFFLEKALDALADNPNIDIYELMKSKSHFIANKKIS
jgi:transposase